MVPTRRHRARAPAPLLVLPLLAVLACERDAAPDRPTNEPSDAAAGSRLSDREAELARAAEAIVGFLRGEVAFERLRLADTVTLHLAPDGGGGARAVPRSGLRDPGSWEVTSPSGRVHSLVPFDGPAERTIRVGRHLPCLERPLSTVLPDVAERPHVGTMLRPPGSTSCLQAWSLTLVFAEEPGPPTLTGAVYDQWEW